MYAKNYPAPIIFINTLYKYKGQSGRFMHPDCPKLSTLNF